VTVGENEETFGDTQEDSRPGKLELESDDSEAMAKLSDQILNNSNRQIDTEERSEQSVTTDEFLYQMDEDIQTGDLYSNGRKIAILRSLIEKQAREADASYGRTKHHKMSALAS